MESAIGETPSILHEPSSNGPPTSPTAGGQGPKITPAGTQALACAPAHTIVGVTSPLMAPLVEGSHESCGYEPARLSDLLRDWVGGACEQQPDGRMSCVYGCAQASAATARIWR